MLDFLKNATLIDVNPAKKAASAASSGTKLERNPQHADIRLFKTGAIYPSAALVDEFDLEYRDKDTKPKDRGTGFDLIDSRDYVQYNQNLPALVLIAPVGKGEGKVDLFAQTNYDAEGKPSSSVKDQGAQTRGKELIETLQEVYGLTEETMFGEQSFVDLRIIRENKLNNPQGVYLVPKKITRGEKKGQNTYERRDNIDIMPLLIAGSNADPKKEEYLKEQEGAKEIVLTLKPANETQSQEVDTTEPTPSVQEEISGEAQELSTSAEQVESPVVMEQEDTQDQEVTPGQVSPAGVYPVEEESTEETTEEQVEDNPLAGLI